MFKAGNKLGRIRALMFCSQAALLLFMGYWLYTQYETGKEEFRKTLFVQFDESQRKVSDALLLSHLAESLKGGGTKNDSLNVTMHVNETSKADHDKMSEIEMVRDAGMSKNEFKISGAKKIIINQPRHTQDSVAIMMEINDSPRISHIQWKETNLVHGEKAHTPQFNIDLTADTIISKGMPSDNEMQAINLIFRKLKYITNSSEQELFKKDTTLFNKEFAEQMQANGWKFKTRWTEDSNAKGNNIFIKSSFFTSSYGLQVSHFSWELVKKVIPQVLFTIILLLLTGFAFRIAYRSLKQQIALTEMKNSFISNMSHELKTPISTVKVALEALSNFNMIEDRQRTKEYLEMAGHEMNRLDMLVNQALNTSMAEQGRIVLQMEKENLKTISEDVLSTMRLRFGLQQAEVRFEATGNNFSSQADRLHIQGVLYNILDNSLKYGGDKPEILFELQEQDNDIEVRISDRGPGIAKEYLKKVFDKFFRVPTGDKHNVKGYGLGLSYASQIMQLHNGSIHAEQRAGGGSTFILRFSKAA